MKSTVLSFSCLFFTMAYDRIPYKLETVVERFGFGDYNFIFYSQFANWEEAYTICKATHSRLAVVNTSARAKFLSDALSQTKDGFDDVWIGGGFRKDRWRWVATDQVFSERRKDFPPWLSYPTLRGKNCLSLDRKNHNEPLFVEKRCGIERPFVCEESVNVALDNAPEGRDSVQINDREYLIYHARVTWDEALAFCKQTLSRFASIPDLETANQLVEFMKRARPPFESVWIGAKRSYLEWIWVSTHETLPNETQKYGFPPWSANSPTDMKKRCVLLDHHPCPETFHRNLYLRHSCEEAEFVEADCDIKKDFVCETGQEENVEQEKLNVITVDQLTYVLYHERLSWIDAKLACERIQMTLATPETGKQWKTILMHMADVQAESDHVWLGGLWRSNEWLWLNNRSIPLPAANKEYPPWCRAMELHTNDKNCLNLDRDAHNLPVVYGFNCAIKQKFMCQLEAPDFINPPDAATKHLFKYEPNASTHFDASSLCKSAHSHLAIVNNIQLAQKLALMIPSDSLVWLGAKRVNSVWRWSKTQELIPDFQGEDGYPPWESLLAKIGATMCLAIKSGFREQPLFVETPCKEKLNYLCQSDPKEMPQPDVLMDFNGIKHYFYKKGANWTEAMFTCSSGNMFLANVGNLALANFLVDGMGDAGPQWTSGNEVLPNSWVWVTSGSKVPRGVPFWFSNRTSKNTEPATCVLLDKHDESPIFKSENCSRLHSFVCIDKIFIHNETEIGMGNLTISLRDVITSIAKAKKGCVDSGKRVVDFSQLNQRELLKIMQMKNVKSFWVDVVHNSQGKWVYADTLKEFKTNIYFPKRYSLSRNDPKNCLTLQLLLNNRLALIPALCSDFSRIICISVAKKSPVPGKVDRVLNESVQLVAVFKPTRLSDARLVCNDVGGGFIKESALFKEAVKFFNELPEDYGNFWLGATFSNGTWRWVEDASPVTSLGTLHFSRATITRFGNDAQSIEKPCLIYNRKLADVETVSCLDKYSTICEIVTGKCPPKSAQHAFLEWSPAKCTKGPLNPGTVCRAKCKNDSNLVGHELYICANGKWSIAKEPICRNDASHGQRLLRLATNKSMYKTPQTLFVFIIDMGVNRTVFGKLINFAKSLADTMLLNEHRRVCIELYSYKAKIIDVMEHSNCYLIQTMKLLSKRAPLSNSQPNYYGAFLTAEQELIDKRHANDAVFIYFFAMRPDWGSMNKTVVIDRLRKMGVTLVVITVGDKISRSQLEEMASTKYDELQLYSFQTLEGLKIASNYLQKASKTRPMTCGITSIPES